ncbi:ATP-dependent exoDNAse (exonuclease V) beta subunit (contains helicase and exonuclease domains) [Halorubrum xinjiangense]|uniref:DNA 3'-5' helicase n=1 Tax=Halorubrum xinjiangense TaxID=261291 RepID=A0A1G7NW65_9EURY|nr:ATP-dependent DNA helicase [Halorubrum xinjiangense]SDF78244.1 ATP-dependent exoDNAse (exonuclease V) beta subunit (contains helicase and exonuclease domains) [Halorubrum xinjiangense]
MSEPTPNDAQRELIESTEGPYLVDAGPGTGKTFAVTRRYGRIVDRPDVEPDDVLLATFTRSAATEMKERIVDHSAYDLRELADAPIRTFHSHCHELLREHGFAAPTHLGLDERITGSTRILEDELIEAERFREFFGGFRDDHPEHADFYRALSAPGELLDLIEELASKGIFPTADGWYRNGEAHLDGDFAAFEDRFDDVNRPRNDGRKQSKLRGDLSGFGRDKAYRPDAPSKSTLRGGRGTKRLDDDVARQVFYEDRSALKAFVHDVYVEYLRFALRRNYLSFSFLQLFAFVLLCEDERAREAASFEYVMVDEFQDTSEVQFKLALLLSGSDNFCVVGDWKQSIYSFQYADVRNITEFGARLERFAADLNDDADRVPFDSPDPTTIELRENYRSTESVIDLSERAIVTPAASGDAVDTDLDDVVELSSNAAFDNTVVEGVRHEDEHEAVLSKVQEIVGDNDYAVEGEDGEPRPPEYGDVAVFTRTRDYGRELLDVADEYDFPLAYDGGIELFRTDPAKLLLAWLRILESDADRGWAVVLERIGYAFDEIDRLLETGSYPAEPAAFRDELCELASVGAVARRVLDRYGFTGDVADVLLHTVQSVHDSTTATRGELIRHIERGVETGSTVDVRATAGDDAVTVQTIHTAKGLEYPIVVMANMNAGRFPARSGRSSVIQYRDPVGLRQRKLYSEEAEHPHVYDSWRHDVIRRCLPRAYDEERRLLYVAVTRAESHVVFAAGEDPNTFLEELPVAVEEIEPDVEPLDRGEPADAELPFAVTAPDGPIGHTPHSLMDESVFEQSGERPETGPEAEPEPETRGMDFGSRVHDFAEAYALGDDVTPSNDHERRIVELLDGLSGEKHVEEPVTLPIDVDGRRVTVSGIADLVHETADRIEVIDYKTDATRRAESEYRKQLSVYYHVLDEWFADKQVETSLFYTSDGTRERIEPHLTEELRAFVRAAESATE